MKKLHFYLILLLCAGCLVVACEVDFSKPDGESPIQFRAQIAEGAGVSDLISEAGMLHNDLCDYLLNDCTLPLAADSHWIANVNSYVHDFFDQEMGTSSGSDLDFAIDDSLRRWLTGTGPYNPFYGQEHDIFGPIIYELRNGSNTVDEKEVVFIEALRDLMNGGSSGTLAQQFDYLIDSLDNLIDACELSLAQTGSDHSGAAALATLQVAKGSAEFWKPIYLNEPDNSALIPIPIVQLDAATYLISWYEIWSDEAGRDDYDNSNSGQWRRIRHGLEGAAKASSLGAIKFK